MKTYSLKWITFLLVLVAISGYWLSGGSITESLALNKHEESQQLELPTTTGSEHIHKGNPVDSALPDPAAAKKRTATEVAVVDDWLSKAGYKVRDRETYLNYTDEQLSALVEKGDTNAMITLSDRYSNDATKQDFVKSLASKAVVYGSLKAIELLSIYNMPYVKSTDYGTPVEKIKADMMESFAYCKLLALRGNTYNAQLRIESDTKAFKKAQNTDTLFSVEEEAQIDKRAKELYDYYQAERNKLGLGDFDNEVPKEVKDFLGM